MRLASATACLALLLPLAACTGGGDDATTFCEQSESTLAEVDAAGTLGDDTAGFVDAVSEISDGFTQADPPSEIADDWRTLGGVFADLDEQLQAVDPEDQDAVAAALTGFSEQANSTSLADASDRVSRYIAENCTE
ncbi:hypothetical protein [Cellulomonas sp. NPDC089187]|uniref:hypothetical protein n=1 Tax=Cellulomonas sp. NPDC089187 TaxID=3154970 RepID=UPI0034246E0E